MDTIFEPSNPLVEMRDEIAAQIRDDKDYRLLTYKRLATRRDSVLTLLHRLRTGSDPEDQDMLLHAFRSAADVALVQPEVLTFLQEALSQDTYIAAREAIAQTLATGGLPIFANPSMKPALLEATYDLNAGVRGWVVAALAVVVGQEREVRQRLVEMACTDPDCSVSREAKVALAGSSTILRILLDNLRGSQPMVDILSAIIPTLMQRRTAQEGVGFVAQEALSASIRVESGAFQCSFAPQSKQAYNLYVSVNSPDYAGRMLLIQERDNEAPADSDLLGCLILKPSLLEGECEGTLPCTGPFPHNPHLRITVLEEAEATEGDIEFLRSYSEEIVRTNAPEEAALWEEWLRSATHRQEESHEA